VLDFGSKPHSRWGLSRQIFARSETFPEQPMQMTHSQTAQFLRQTFEAALPNGNLQISKLAAEKVFPRVLVEQPLV
jgi:hypothetical protein